MRVLRHPAATAVLQAVLTGVLLACSFPHFGHAAVAWVALVPLLQAVASSPRRQAGWLGLAAGVVHFAGAIYWIPEVMVTFGRLPPATAWAVHALLVVYLALFPALFARLVAELMFRLGPGGLLLAPAVWVTSELGRIYLFTGFPWVLLGYSQVPFLAVAQAASVIGVLGVSALVVSVNAAVVYAIRSRAGVAWTPLVATGGVVLAVGLAGQWRLSRDALLTAGTPLTVAALQGNVQQEDKWEPGRSDAIVDTYLRQTATAAAAGASLIVWPEAATPFPFEHDRRGEAIRAAARQTQAHLLIGSTEIETVASTASPRAAVETRYYNAAYMLDPTGATVGIYRKQHLVPFGEYVPLRRALFFISPLVETVAGFSAGTGPRPLPMGDDHAVGTAICYEIIYPGLVGGIVGAGTHLLTTLTNDAWYGRSAAPHQHFQQARMRAIEQGRFLVRAANTGISGVIDPYGRVVVRSSLFEPAVMVETVRLLNGVTVYGRLGDLPAYAGVVITVLALVRRRPSWRTETESWR